MKLRKLPEHTGRALGALLLATASLAGGRALAQTAPTAAPLNSMPYMYWSWLSALHAPGPASLASQGIGATVPGTEYDLNAYGVLETYQPAGPTTTATNAFFQALGTNGRSCATCHQPSSGMSVSLPDIVGRYLVNGPKDPLFAPVDGANCPNQVPATYTKKSYLGGNLGKGKSLASAYSLILTRGVIRIFLPVPAAAEYTLTVVSDPTTCNTDPNYAWVVDPAGVSTQIVSVFRRPIMSGNLAFKTNTLAYLFQVDPITGIPFTPDPVTGALEGGNIMWDGREGNLQSQAIDATLGHAQATSQPSAAAVSQMVAFEQGVFVAQASRLISGSLSANGETGGPATLTAPYTAAPTAIAPGPKFNLFDSLASVTGTTAAALQQQSIYRGQEIFNNRPFTVADVAGLNNVPGLGSPGLPSTGNPVTGATCATCHNAENDGTDAAPQAQHGIGTGGGSTAFGGSAPATDLPIFQLVCNNGASTVYNGTTVLTNDPGKALITGKCADIGAYTVPQLRALASRRPYFHDGSASSLTAVVNFYNKRFTIGLSAQDTSDLVNFLASL